ncbi:MAG: hypothetical protein IRZ05_06735 [Micromonosporaceae bacterium]|nr:hypothetical protein [Micromonosporaceae bacterium]
MIIAYPLIADGEVATGEARMPHSGAQLGVDLYRLHRLATDNLPTVADVYAAAAVDVGDTDAGLAAVFPRPPQFGGVNGPAYAPWLELRDAVQSFLSQTAQNLIDTAAAVRTAITLYAEADQRAAEELSRLRARDGAG